MTHTIPQSSAIHSDPQIKHVAPFHDFHHELSAPTSTLAMRPPRLFSLLLLPLTLTQALKFELSAQPQAHLTPRCIRNYVAADTLVVVTATVSGSKGDGQWVNIEVPPSTLIGGALDADW